MFRILSEERRSTSLNWPRRCDPGRRWLLKPGCIGEGLSALRSVLALLAPTENFRLGPSLREADVVLARRMFARSMRIVATLSLNRR
jgi:hypothetical protein